MVKMLPGFSATVAQLRNTLIEGPSTTGTENPASGPLLQSLERFRPNGLSNRLARQVAAHMAKSGDAGKAPPPDLPPAKPFESDVIPGEHWRPAEGRWASEMYRSSSPRPEGGVHAAWPAGPPEPLEPDAIPHDRPNPDAIPAEHWRPHYGIEKANYGRTYAQLPQDVSSDGGSPGQGSRPPTTVPARKPVPGAAPNGKVGGADEAPLHVSIPEVQAPRPKRPFSPASLETALSSRSSTPVLAGDGSPVSPMTAFGPEDAPTRAGTPAEGGTPLSALSRPPSPPSPSVFSDAGRTSGASTPLSEIGDDLPSATLGKPFEPAFAVPEQVAFPPTPARSEAARPSSAPVAPSASRFDAAPPQSASPALPPRRPTPASAHRLAQSPQTWSPPGRPNAMSSAQRLSSGPAEGRGAMRTAWDAWKGLGGAISRLLGADLSAPRPTLGEMRDSVRGAYHATRAALSMEPHVGSTTEGAQAFAREHAGKPGSAGVFQRLLQEFSQAVGEALTSGSSANPDQRAKVHGTYTRADAFAGVMIEGNAAKREGIDEQLKEKRETLGALPRLASSMAIDKEQMPLLERQIRGEVADLERQKAALM